MCYNNTTLSYQPSAMDFNSSYQLQDKPSSNKPILNWYYITFEILVGVVAVVGNALVIAVFSRERRLRRRTNYYIVSLAVADLLVGLLGIPFAILTSVGLPSASIHTCLFTVSLLMVLCTISIFCLVAVSVDRYWAILHPMDYSRNVRTRTALVIIAICWFSGSFIGFIPLMGWYQKQDSHTPECYFLHVMDYNYLVFAYFTTIIAPALLLAVFYIHIYHVVLKQIRRMRSLNPELDNHTIEHSSSRGSSGTMLRILGAAQKREVKATQNLSIIVLFFMVCWIPLYTINCTLAFCKDCIDNIHPILMYSCIILSHVNSAGNPLLYAYHLKDFRAAMKRFILCMVGIKTQPHLIRPNGSQVTTFTSYYQHRCRSQPYLPHLLQDRPIVQSKTEVPLMHMAGLHKQEKKMCSPSQNAEHLEVMPFHQTKAIVRNTVNLVTVAVQNKRDLWRISSSSECDLPSISGESNSSDCTYKKHREKYPTSKLFDQRERDNDEVLSLMYLNLHTLDKKSLNNKNANDGVKLQVTLHNFIDFTNQPTHTYSSGIIRNMGNFDNHQRDGGGINNRSKSCTNVKLSATSENNNLRQLMTTTMTKDESLFHIMKKHSASTTCCESNSTETNSLKYSSAANLTL